MQAVRKIAAVPACELVIMSDANSLFINEILAAADLTAFISQARAPPSMSMLHLANKVRCPPPAYVILIGGQVSFPELAPAWCL